MNVDEGEAAGAFTFKTERDFIDWLLTSVLDDEDPRSFADAFDKLLAAVENRSAKSAPSSSANLTYHLPDNLAQAEERADPKRGDKGYEAAVAAAALVVLNGNEAPRAVGFRS